MKKGSTLVLFAVVLTASAVGYVFVGPLFSSDSQSAEELRAKRIETHAFIEEHTDYGDIKSALATIEMPEGPPHGVVAPTLRVEVDTEWGKLPVGLSFAEQVVRDRDILDVSAMFRSADLNPGDKRIAPEERAHIEKLVDSYRGRLGELKELEERAGHREFSTLANAGRAQAVNLDSYYQKLSDKEREAHEAAIERSVEKTKKALRERGIPEALIEKAVANQRPVAYEPSRLFGKGVYASRVEDGEATAVQLGDLPITKQARDTRDAVLLNLVALVVGRFAHSGCLDSSRASSLQAVIATGLYSK